MTTLTWTQGAAGDWFTAANWTPAQVPKTGDTAVVHAGTPTVSAGAPAVRGVSIVLGGLTVAQPVTLKAIDATFEGVGTPPNETDTVIDVTGGQPVTSPFNAVFLAEGNTSFDGQILVTAPGGSLTIESQSDGTSDGNFLFDNADQKAVMVVEQESLLAFTGQTVTNDGLIEVEGGADIAAGVTFTGSGLVVLENGGQMSIAGTVANTQSIDFQDGTGLVKLANGGFKGIFGFVSTVSGDRIDLTQVKATSAQYFAPSSAGKPGKLELFDLQGNEVATLDMQLINPANLDSLGGDGLSTADFTVGSDDASGTLITYAPPNGIQLQQSLPVPIVAAAGTTVSFASILRNAFGTAAPNFTSITLLPTPVFKNTATDIGYWASPNVTPTWLVNGVPISAATRVIDISEVSLLVGNQIINPAQFQAVVTAATSGPLSETVTYSAWSVDPRVVNAVHQAGFGSVPTPGAVVASANAFASTFGQILNTELCNWIADNVAAGADAPMPLPNQMLDPTLNVQGGFWRIVYTGAQPSPVSNWSTLVQPGDIVRMGWFKPETGTESGHTTTVLAGVGANGKITVFDNIDDVGDQEFIGVHDASYWVSTDPLDITIYRLDPKQQYLIEGTPLAEDIQGSVFNNLIQPGGGADTITGGPAGNEIQDTTAHLDTVTVTNFKVGDTLDFTDLDPARASVRFASDVLLATDGTQVARLALLGLTNPRFTTAPDGNGGTLVALAGGQGDVHMVCFDGLHYDFQAIGDFVAVRSTGPGDPWQVEIRTDSFPGATSVTTGLAATVGADRVSFADGRAGFVEVDGAPDTTLQVGATQRLADGTLGELEAGVYQLTWDSGQQVTIADRGAFLDWTVALGPHDGPGSVQGLLGSNSGPASDFQLPNGTVLGRPNGEEILGVFADAWRVAPGTSLIQAMAGELVPSGIGSPDLESASQANPQITTGLIAPTTLNSPFSCLTGVFDAAQCPFPDARHRHRPGEDPRLGTGGRGARLSRHRGRRPRLRRGAARRLEAGLQRARPVPRDVHHDGLSRRGDQEGRAVQRRADPAAAPGRPRRQAGGRGRHPERRPPAAGRRRRLEPCRVRRARHRMEDARRAAGRADRGHAAAVDQGPGHLPRPLPYAERRQSPAGAGAAADPGVVRRLVGRRRQAGGAHRRRLDADPVAAGGRAQARGAARAPEDVRPRSGVVRARGLAALRRGRRAAMAHGGRRLEAAGRQDRDALSHVPHAESRGPDRDAQTLQGSGGGAVRATARQQLPPVASV
jgi:hypothetical protein